jgi:hypothetical protein
MCLTYVELRITELEEGLYMEETILEASPIEFKEKFKLEGTGLIRRFRGIPKLSINKLMNILVQY